MDTSDKQIWGIEELDSPDQLLRGVERADHIIRAIGKLQNNRFDFSILDIACGDGGVLNRIKEEYPQCKELGIDINYFDSWKDIKARTQQISLQEFMKTDAEQKWDYVLMLNSYRNTPPAFKKEIDAWLKQNAKYFITSLPWEYKYIGVDAKQALMVLLEQ